MRYKKVYWKQNCTLETVLCDWKQKRCFQTITWYWKHSPSIWNISWRHEFWYSFLKINLETFCFQSHFSVFLNMVFVTNLSWLFPNYLFCFVSTLYVFNQVLCFQTGLVSWEHIKGWIWNDPQGRYGSTNGFFYARNESYFQYTSSRTTG